jgi:subtilase family serine protease
MLEIDQLSQPAITLFEKCFKVEIPPVTNTIVADANPEAFGDEAEESTLDIVAAGLLAPNLDGIQTYQFDPYTSMVFALNDAVSASYQPDGPEILSTSIGVCEQNLQGPEISIMEWILNAGAATGLTTVASSGDDGSSACYPQTKDQASQYPGTSGAVTALGGTEFVGTGGPRPSEVVWNNSPSQEQAGGGSQVSRMPKPSYQNSLPGPNNRIIPDIALVAEPADFGPIPVCKNNGQCQMQVVGGTSATAPGYAAALATMLQQLRKNNGAQLRLGSRNPMLYSIAGSPANSSVFNDITQGTNDLYSAGCCTAAPGYDSASGWGSLNFGGLLTAYESTAPKG